MDKIKLIISSAYAAAITIFFVAIITVWAEMSVPLKDWLKNFSGHHWTSKSIFSLLIYAVAILLLYWSLEAPKDYSARRALVFLLWSVIFGTATVTAFFSGHHFGFF